MSPAGGTHRAWRSLDPPPPAPSGGASPTKAPTITPKKIVHETTQLEAHPVETTPVPTVATTPGAGEGSGEGSGAGSGDAGARRHAEELLARRA